MNSARDRIETLLRRRAEIYRELPGCFDTQPLREEVALIDAELGDLWEARRFELLPPRTRRTFPKPRVLRGVL